MIQSIDKAKKISEAINAFTATNPDLSSFPAVDANTQVSWPSTIILSGKVIPINYDETTNTITLRTS